MKKKKNKWEDEMLKIFRHTDLIIHEDIDNTGSEMRTKSYLNPRLLNFINTLLKKQKVRHKKKKGDTQRKIFWDIFRLPKSEYTELTPKVRISIGGITMNPGVKIGSGVTFGNLSLFDPKIYGSDLLVKKEKGSLRIVGYFPDSKS